MIFEKDGRNFKLDFNQCMHEFKNHRCQGCQGHDGEHWFFDVRGWYISATEMYTKSTPPVHVDYKSPVDMFRLHFMNHCSLIEIDK